MHLFYQPLLKKDFFRLENEEFHHCVQVLRHQRGDKINVTDGNGLIAETILVSISKKAAEFEIILKTQIPSKGFSHHLGIAPTKNIDRMEWMIEKVAELQVDEVTFLSCENSERRKIRLDRLEKKVISAMKQSGSPYKTRINDIIIFEEFVEKNYTAQKYIAAVQYDASYLQDILNPSGNYITLIGPEGDFSIKEIELAKERGFIPVKLGSPVLRTETAGLYISSMINFSNRF